MLMDVVLPHLVVVVLLATMHTVNIKLTGAVIRELRMLVERYLDLIGMHYAEVGVVAVGRPTDSQQIG
jgi:hypothetical protein